MSAPRRRRWWTAVLVVALGAAAVLVLLSPWRPPAIGRLVVRAGPVWIADGAGSEPVEGERALRGGERILVGGGEVELALDGGVALALGAGGSLTLPSPERAGGATLLELASGRLDVSVAASPARPPLRVATPHALASVAGTGFTVHVLEHGTLLRVAEGTVRLDRAAGGSATVVAGRRVEAAPDLALVVVEDLAVDTLIALDAERVRHGPVRVDAGEPSEGPPRAGDPVSLSGAEIALVSALGGRRGFGPAAGGERLRFEVFVDEAALGGVDVQVGGRGTRVAPPPRAAGLWYPLDLALDDLDGPAEAVIGPIRFASVSGEPIRVDRIELVRPR